MEPVDRPSSAAELNVTSLDAYLTGAGWVRVDEDTRTRLWTSPESEEVRVVTPLEATSDFSGQAAEALRAIAYVERRPAEDVLEDVVRGGADTVRVRLTPDAPSGEAPLTVAHTVLGAMREYVIASAVGVDTHALVLPPRRPLRAQEYLERARVSTEAGSFVLRVVLPLSERAEEPSRPSGLLVDVAPIPFGRKVSARMRRVAQSAVETARRVERGEADLDVFAMPAREAPNATELSALAELGMQDGVARPYVIRFGQTPISRVSSHAPALVRVSPTDQQIFAGAAAHLRENQERTNVTLAGLVVRLHRNVRKGPGTVWVQALLDDSGRERQVRLQLSGQDYRKALHAHEEGLIVTATGDIRRNGTWTTMSRVRDFEVRRSLFSPELNS